VRLVRDWPRGTIPWEAVPQRERERFFGLFEGRDWGPEHFNDGRIPPWHVLPKETRRHLARFSLEWLEWDRQSQADSVPASPPGQCLQPRPPDGYNYYFHGSDRFSPGIAIDALLRVAGRDELPWGTLLPEEWALLTGPEAAECVRHALQDQVISAETLAAAFHCKPRSPQLEAILAETDHALNQDTLESWRRLFGLDVLEVNRPLAGGLSGALVLRVYFRPEGAGEEIRLGVLKRRPDADEHHRELEGHTRALSSWLGADCDWVPDRPVAKFSTAGNCSLFLTHLAFPVLAGHPEPPTLHERISDLGMTFDPAVTEFVAETIGRGYAVRLNLWFRGSRPGTPATRRGHLLRLLGHWPKFRRAWEGGDRDPLWDLPGGDSPGFQDGTHVRTNPLWLVQQPRIADDDQLMLPVEFQHGDLNARNVLVAPDAGTTPERVPLVQLIDFEKAGEQFLGLDLCWLAFTTLMASARQVRLDSAYWLHVPDAFARAVFAEPRGGHLGDFQLGLDVIRRLFTPFHTAPPAGAPELRGVVLGDLLPLLVGGSALAKVLYEMRDVRKRVDQGDAVTSDANRRKRLWALTFFRISAAAFSRLGAAHLGGAATTWSVEESLERIRRQHAHGRTDHPAA
jgi:hypothetical protein